MYPSASVIPFMTLLVCLCGLGLASPVDAMVEDGGPMEPAIALSQMAPDHACLFICTICFPGRDDIEHLMDCSNKVCGPVSEGRCAMEKFIWLGHHCRAYGMVEAMWAPRR